MTCERRPVYAVADLIAVSVLAGVGLLRLVSRDVGLLRLVSRGPESTRYVIGRA